MVLSMYQGTRYIKVHGRTIHTGEFQQGIIAGCSWAKDILKVLIGDIKKRCDRLGLTLRDYVDDIMLREVSHDVDTLVHKAYAGLQYAKQLIRQTGLKDNEAKEQILITNKQVSDAFKAAYPDAADKVVHTAKDLGVCQRRHNHTNTVILQRIKDKKAYAGRVRTLRDLTQSERAVAIEMGHNGSVFYGTEIDPPTQKQLAEVRGRNHDAIYPTNRTQEPHIALALMRKGKSDPETFYHVNALPHWRRECLLNNDFAENITHDW